MNTNPPNRVEARFYEKMSWDNVTCHLCPHRCSIVPSRTGICGVRGNRDGVLYVDTYQHVSQTEVLSADDLPLFHYKPSISWLQLATRGCTMRCPFCNTYRFSQTGGVRSFRLTIEEIIAKARADRCQGISFGVNEPAPAHEFVFDTFKAARAAGLETHVATGGMWSREALRELTPFLSAATVGLKGLDASFLTGTLGSNKEAVLGNIDLLLTRGVHVEITWLVIPGLTDDAAQASDLRSRLSMHENPPPIILLPFEPGFTWREPAPARLAHLRQFHKFFIGYAAPVYEFHADSTAMNTLCTNCGRPLIRRGIAGLIITSVPGGEPRKTCPACGTPVPYVIE